MLMSPCGSLARVLFHCSHHVVHYRLFSSYLAAMFALRLLITSRRCLLLSALILLALLALLHLQASPSSLRLGQVVKRVFMATPATTCEPRHNILFLKTHKCASTTVQSILLRYGYRHNLTFVLPRDAARSGANLLAWPWRLDVDRVVWRPDLAPYNILAHHFVYEPKVVWRLLHGDAVKVTILRRPADLYRSFYRYFDLDHQKINMPYEEFVANVSRNSHLFIRKNYYFPYRNPLMLDLGLIADTSPAGLDLPQHTDPRFISQAVKFVAQEFDLVMIKELLDESLVLLRHLLCWRVEDMVSISSNVRVRGKGKSEGELAPASQRALRQWNLADNLLYDHFYQVMRDMIRQFGEQRMRAEVEELRAVRRRMLDQCIDTGDTKTFVYNRFKTGADGCDEALGYHELQFTKILAEKQKQSVEADNPSHIGLANT